MPRSAILLLLSIVTCTSGREFAIKTRELLFDADGQIKREDQPFIRVFFSDEEIEQLYSSEAPPELPTMYDFGPKLMAEITRRLLANNEKRYVTDPLALQNLSPSEQLHYLTNSQLIGEPKYDMKASLSGEDVLKMLVQRSELYKQLCEGNSSFQEYLAEWQDYYDCLAGKWSNQVVLAMMRPREQRRQKFDVNLEGPCQKSKCFLLIANELLGRLKKANTRLMNIENMPLGKTKIKPEITRISQEIEGYLTLILNSNFAKVAENYENDSAIAEVMDKLWSEWAASELLFGNVDRELQKPEKKK